MTPLDPLTGLPDQREFQYRLEHEMARARRYFRTLSVVIVEIDSHEDLCERWGRGAIQAALCQVATIIRTHSRAVDFPARYSDERLAVVLPETNARGAQVYAERLRRMVEKAPFVPPGAKVETRLTVSAGTSSLDIAARGAVRLNVLLARAESALALAKSGGGNRVCQFG